MRTSRITQPLIDRRHRLGHDAIDSDHAALSACWVDAVNCRPIEFPLRLARLKKLMARHFEHESALLVQKGQALCRYHHVEHRMLLELCDQIAACHGRDRQQAQSLLRNQFAERVREHIVTMDQCAVLLMRGEIRCTPH